MRQIAIFGDQQALNEAALAPNAAHRLRPWWAPGSDAMPSASFYGNIWADGTFKFEPPGKNPSMRHVNVCSACGKPQSVASVTCLWCGQPKKLFSGRLVAILKAVLAGIGFLVKRGRAVSS